MVQTLQEYVNWLDEKDLNWPEPPNLIPTKATPYIKPLEGIKAVSWDIYGTILRISGGDLLTNFPDETQKLVACDKIVNEFNMWQSMTRKPGPPGEQILLQFDNIHHDLKLTSSQSRGDISEVDSSAIWNKILGMLAHKGYGYDVDFYGDVDELSDKMAYYFHANVQGVAANPNALKTMLTISRSPMLQSLLSNAQAFTLVQLLRALKQQGTLPPLGKLIDLRYMTLSFQARARKPSASLYREALEKYSEAGIQPEEILHVGSRVEDDLAIAKKAGMKTVLFAGDRNSLKATKNEMKDPEVRPDRLITELSQLIEILGI